MTNEKKLEAHVNRLSIEAKLGTGFCIVVMPVLIALAVWQASIGNVTEAVAYIEIGGVAAECLRKVSRDSNRHLNEILVGRAKKITSTENVPPPGFREAPPDTGDVSSPGSKSAGACVGELVSCEDK